MPYENEKEEEEETDDEAGSGVDNTEFITIKVTNTKGEIEKQEVDEIKELKVVKKFVESLYVFAFHNNHLILGKRAGPR